MSEKETENEKTASRSNKPNAGGNSQFSWRTLFRIVVAVLVAAAVVYTAIKSSKQLSESDFDFGEVNYFCWFGALAAYVVTMLFSLVFWHRVLLALGQQPKFKDSMLAFFASQLGKYIPGKAMVVVIRTDMIRGDDVKTAPAAASVFVETLTWIFVGSVIGSLLLVTQFKDQIVPPDKCRRNVRWLLACSLGHPSFEELLRSSVQFPKSVPPRCLVV